MYLVVHNCWVSYGFFSPWERFFFKSPLVFLFLLFISEFVSFLFQEVHSHILRKRQRAGKWEQREKREKGEHLHFRFSKPICRKHHVPGDWTVGSSWFFVSSFTTTRPTFWKVGSCTFLLCFLSHGIHFLKLLSFNLYIVQKSFILFAIVSTFIIYGNE